MKNFLNNNFHSTDINKAPQMGLFYLALISFLKLISFWEPLHRSFGLQKDQLQSLVYDSSLSFRFFHFLMCLSFFHASLSLLSFGHLLNTLP